MSHGQLKIRLSFTALVLFSGCQLSAKTVHYFSGKFDAKDVTNHVVHYRFLFEREFFPKENRVVETSHIETNGELDHTTYVMDHKRGHVSATNAVGEDVGQGTFVCKRSGHTLESIISCTFRITSHGVVTSGTDFYDGDRKISFDEQVSAVGEENAAQVKLKGSGKKVSEKIFRREYREIFETPKSKI